MLKNNIIYFINTNKSVELVFCENSTISYPLHNHVSAFTIGLVLDGSIVLNIDKSSCICEKGQTFTIAPYLPHSIMPNNCYTMISICIYKKLLGCSYCEKAKIKSDITKMLNKLVDKSKISQSEITQLLNCFDGLSNEELHLAFKQGHCDINKLIRQIEQFPENSYSIDKLSRTAFTSKYHFIRLFKQTVGLTPHQFALQNRIRKAKRMINNDNSIAKTALDAGFCDQSHFIKQFEKRVGLTPTLYKKSCRILSEDFII